MCAFATVGPGSHPGCAAQRGLHPVGDCGGALHPPGAVHRPAVLPVQAVRVRLCSQRVHAGTPLPPPPPPPFTPSIAGLANLPIIASEEVKSSYRDDFVCLERMWWGCPADGQSGIYQMDMALISDWQHFHDESENFSSI